MKVYILTEETIDNECREVSMTLVFASERDAMASMAEWWQDTVDEWDLTQDEAWIQGRTAVAWICQGRGWLFSVTEKDVI